MSPVVSRAGEQHARGNYYLFEAQHNRLELSVSERDEPPPMRYRASNIRDRKKINPVHNEMAGFKSDRKTVEGKASDTIVVTTPCRAIGPTNRHVKSAASEG